MKKIFAKLLIVMLAVFLCTGSLIITNKSAFAEEISIEGETSPNTEISQKIDTYLSEFVLFDSRVAGSENEKKAGEYIWNKLNLINGLEAVTSRNSKDEKGYQSFTFSSAIDGKQHQSQNIIFSHKASTKTDRKVILCCSYDAIAFNEKGEVKNSQGVNGSAGSVAVLLTLAEFLCNQDLKYNLEFVFLGAGASNCAGAEFYTNGISTKDKENILLALNLDTISIGKNLYFYVDEIKTNFSTFADDLAETNKLKATEVNTANLGKILLSEPSELGLSYTHIALDSNNYKFMKLGILSMNLFAGDYSSGVVIGRNEYEGKNVVTFTENDNLEFISKNFGGFEVSNKLLECFVFISNLMTDSNFVSACINSAGETNAFYNFFANQKLILYLTVVVFILSIILALLIYYKLSVKSFKADIESQFASSVMSISQNIGGEQNITEVPKVVSKVIANDIKKNNKIKTKKDKNNS